MESKETLPKKKWRTTNIGANPLKKIYATTDRVSTDYTGKVEFDKNIGKWNFVITKVETDETFENKKSSGYETLCYAKTYCCREIVLMPHHGDI